MGAIDIRMQSMVQDNRAHGALLQNHGKSSRLKPLLQPQPMAS